MEEEKLKELELLRADKKQRDEEARDLAESQRKADSEEFQKSFEDLRKELPLLKQEILDIKGTRETKKTPEGLMAHALYDLHNKHEGNVTIENGLIVPKQLMENGRVVQTRAADPMLVGTDASGGFLVPDMTQGSIMEYAITYGQAFQVGMTQIPMGQNVLTMPAELTNPTWDWDISEGGSVTSSKATLAPITLTPYKGGAIVVLTPELIMGSYLPIGAYVNKKIGIARAYGTDGQVFVGSGSPFTGLFTTGITWGNTQEPSGISLENLDYEDFTKCRYGVDEAKLTGASWLMNRLIMERTRRITDDYGRPLLVEANADTPPTILGKPVKLIEQAPSTAVASTPIILLGNFSNSLIGNVQGSMRMRMLYEGTIDTTSLAQYDLVGIRVMDQMAYTNGLVLEYSAIQFAAA